MRVLLPTIKRCRIWCERVEEAGFTAAELKAAGFTPAQLKAAGFSAKDLKEAGFLPLS